MKAVIVIVLGLASSIAQASNWIYVGNYVIRHKNCDVALDAHSLRTVGRDQYEITVEHAYKFSQTDGNGMVYTDDYSTQRIDCLRGAMSTQRVILINDGETVYDTGTQLYNPIVMPSPSLGRDIINSVCSNQ
jgi:hypothetical protein